MHLYRPQDPFGSTLETMISLNLRYLEDDCGFQNLIKITGMNLTFRFLYSSLCILHRQKRATFSRLSQLWGVDELVAEQVGHLLHTMGLPRLESEVEDTGQPISGLLMHGIFLKYCCRSAREGEMKETWYTRLLHVKCDSRWLK